MAIDFTLVLAARALDLPVMFANVEERLYARGFWRSTEVIVSVGEAEVEREETVIVESIMREAEALRSATSIYMEFSCSSFRGLGVQFDRRAAGYSNGFVSLDRAATGRLHRDGIPIQLYSAFAVVAEASDATGGFGGFAVSREPISPEEVLSDIAEAPADRDRWSDVVLLRKCDPAGSRLASAWASDFERLEEAAFVFFINRDFLARWRHAE
jgi:hypothetical protein